MVWPLGSRLLLDTFESPWTAEAHASVSSRLESAFSVACDAFGRNAGTLDVTVGDCPPGFGYGTLLAVALAGSVAEVAWVGPVTTVLVRGSNAVSRTRPHTNLERLRDEGLRPPEPPNPLLGRLTRHIFGRPKAQP